MKDINYIVIHCSASPQGRGDTAETIHQWHQEREWTGIGYHFVILEDGTVEAGRPEYWDGAHARGYNDRSLGICLIGMGGDATAEQMNALDVLVNGLADVHYEAEVVGHDYLDAIKPNCPGFNVKSWWDSHKN